MSFIYSKLMEFFINWENHEKQSQFDNELTIKVVFYEFVNHYVSLFYIAFFKVQFTIKIKNKFNLVFN